MATTLSDTVLSLYPSLERHLAQTSGEKPEPFLMRGARLSIAVGAAATFLLLLIFPSWAWLGPLSTLLLFFKHLIGPRIEAEKLSKTIEQDLPYALRDILVQVRAGAPLFEALKSVRHGYGTISNLFGRMVNEIESGKPLAISLEQLSSRCESEHLQRAIWQLQNAMKSGARMDRALEISVMELNRSQKESIGRYSKELSFWTMIYLVLGLVFPSLGITFLNVMFAVMGGTMTPPFFAFFAFFYVLLLFFMIRSIKSKKPVAI